MTESMSLRSALLSGAHVARRCWRNAFVYLSRTSGKVMLSSYGDTVHMVMEFSSLDTKANDWYLVWSPPPGAG